MFFGGPEKSQISWKIGPRTVWTPKFTKISWISGKHSVNTRNFHFLEFSHFFQNLLKLLRKCTEKPGNFKFARFFRIFAILHTCAHTYFSTESRFARPKISQNYHIFARPGFSGRPGVCKNSNFSLFFNVKIARIHGNRRQKTAVFSKFPPDFPPKFGWFWPGFSSNLTSCVHTPNGTHSLKFSGKIRWETQCVPGVIFGHFGFPKIFKFFEIFRNFHVFFTFFHFLHVINTEDNLKYRKKHAIFVKSVNFAFWDFSEFSKISQNLQKLVKIGKNWPRVEKFAKNSLKCNKCIRKHVVKTGKIPVICHLFFTFFQIFSRTGTGKLHLFFEFPYFVKNRNFHHFSKKNDGKSTLNM